MDVGKLDVIGAKSDVSNAGRIEFGCRASVASADHTLHPQAQRFFIGIGLHEDNAVEVAKQVGVVGNGDGAFASLLDRSMCPSRFQAAAASIDSLDAQGQAVFVLELEGGADRLVPQGRAHIDGGLGEVGLLGKQDTE